MILGILLLGLLGVFAEGVNAEEPSEFYIVSFVDHDVVGAWEYRILDVKQDGLDSLVRSILIGPVRPECPRRLTVRAAEARLPNISPDQLTANQNPCNGNPRSEDKATRSVVGFGTISRAGVVAKCGMEEKVGSLTSLGALTRQTVDRAFSGRDIFWGISQEEDLIPQYEGEKLIAEIISGGFDKGLSAAFRDEKKQQTFRDLLKDYTGVVRASEFIERRLVTSNDYRITKYVEPDYPSLGVAALVLGKVELRLGIDPAAGNVRSVTVIHGQTELAERASKAAQNWEFEPGSIDSESINVVVDFKFRCP